MSIYSFGCQNGLEVERPTSDTKVAGSIPCTNRRVYSTCELATRGWLIITYAVLTIFAKVPMSKGTEPQNSSRGAAMWATMHPDLSEEMHTVCGGLCI